MVYITNIWGILMVNVTIYLYIAYMDPMGICTYIYIYLTPHNPNISQDGWSNSM
jgi:hypothetical protein